MFNSQGFVKLFESSISIYLSPKFSSLCQYSLLKSCIKILVFNTLVIYVLTELIDSFFPKYLSCFFFSHTIKQFIVHCN